LILVEDGGPHATQINLRRRRPNTEHAKERRNDDDTD